MKIKKGDNVKVVAGKDSGKLGRVERIYSANNRVLVAGVNEYKRHVKSRAQNQKSEIITISKPLPVSNVAIICPKCKKQTRIGWKFEKEEKIRICRKCLKNID